MQRNAVFAIGAACLIASASASASASAQALDCPVPGTTLDWAKDQCLLETGASDADARPVRDCLAEADTVEQPCDWNIAYKQRYCATLIDTGQFDGTLDGCISDPSRVGPTVRDTIRAESDEN